MRVRNSLKERRQRKKERRKQLFVNFVFGYFSEFFLLFVFGFVIFVLTRKRRG